MRSFWLFVIERFSEFCSKKTSVFGFGVHCGLRIFCFFAFNFRLLSKIIAGFWIWHPMWFLFFLFVFRFLFDLSACTDLESGGVLPYMGYIGMCGPKG